MANEAVLAKVENPPPEQGSVFTSFGPMPIPGCALTFYKMTQHSYYRTRPNSRIRKKWERYARWVDLYAMKVYQNGENVGTTMAPTWGEFDVHDMLTSQK